MTSVRDLARDAALRIPPLRRLHAHARRQEALAAEAQAEAGRLRATNERLMQRLEQAARAGDEAQTGWTASREAADATLRDLRTALAATETRVQTLQRSLDAAQAAAAEAARRAAAELESATGKVSALEARASTAEALLSRATADRDALATERDTLAEAARAERDQLLRAAAEERDRVTAHAREEVATLARLAQTAEATALERAREERDALTERIRELETRLRETETQLQQASGDRDALRGRLQERETEAARRTREFEAFVESARTERDAGINAARRDLERVELAVGELGRLIGMVEALWGVVARTDHLELVGSSVLARFEHVRHDLVHLRRVVEAQAAGGGAQAEVARRLYLDLLESALTGVLYGDENVWDSAPKVFDPNTRMIGRDWPRMAKTMIGLARMRNLRMVVEQVLNDGVPGDLLEAGVWRGGACIYMRGILAAHADTGRKVWVADSFEGLPPPETDLYPADEGDKHYTFEQLAISVDEVRANFQQFGLLDEQVEFLKGFFADTLPRAPVERLAVLRLDGDMYSSTMDTLESLYSKVEPGGFVVVDDYILPTCRKATDDFRAQHGISEPLHDVDGAAVYWRKEKQVEVASRRLAAPRG